MHVVRDSGFVAFWYQPFFTIGNYGLSMTWWLHGVHSSILWLSCTHTAAKFPHGD